MIQFVPYQLDNACFKLWDPIYLSVALQIIEHIQNPKYEYLHFGSTSFGASGKGIIDLSVLYSKGELADAIASLVGLGFENQHSSNPFPMTRPRFDIGVKIDNTVYMIHAHVIEKDSDEHQKQLAFKHAMLNNPSLRQDYEATKQSIISDGHTHHDSYGKHKGVYVKQQLANIHYRKS